MFYGNHTVYRIRRKCGICFGIPSIEDYFSMGSISLVVSNLRSLLNFYIQIKLNHRLLFPKVGLVDYSCEISAQPAPSYFFLEKNLEFHTDDGQQLMWVKNS